VAERGRKRHAAKIARNGNWHVGVGSGFIWFGSLYEKILRHIHATGPTSHADLREDIPEEIGLSVALSRLAACGFPHRVDYQASKTGARGGYVFDLGPTKSTPAAPSRYVSQKRYKTAKPLRVASVFDFRGSFDL
jgi:hypothetical protein